MTKKAIYYGSKSSLTFILDRTNGKPITGVVEGRVPTDSRQMQPRRPAVPGDGTGRRVHRVREARPEQHPWQSVARRAELQRLSSRCERQSGLHRAELPRCRQAVPDDPAGYTVQQTARTHRMGCLYDPHWDFPVLSTTTQNGGNDFSGQSFVQHRNMLRHPVGVANVAHYRSAGSNGLRAPGQYQGGRYPRAERRRPVSSCGTRSTPVSTWRTGRPRSRRRRDLVFVGRDDGYIVALDA